MQQYGINPVLAGESMENRIVYSEKVGGAIRAPASKSAMQRAIACATLAQGRSRIFGAPLCDDAHAALHIAEGLGAAVHAHDGAIEIEGSKRFFQEDDTGTISREQQRPLQLSCGESGLCMRMFAPIAALLDKPVQMEAEGTLQKRPMAMVEYALKAFGADCAAQEGLPPLFIRGPLQPKFVTLDAKGSSQLITGLLISLPLLHGDSELSIENMVSAGYLDLTLEICSQFGVHIDKVSSDGRTARFLIKGNQSYEPASLRVEGDWSGAAFLAVAAAIAGKPEGLCIQGLKKDSLQPDRAIVDVLVRAGARVQFDGSDIIVKPGDCLPFEFDATDCPDLFPPLAVLASAAKGISSIRGVHRLSVKESNRALALQDMLGRIGIRSKIVDDALQISGGHFRGGRVESHNDHRIAMAAAIAGLAAGNPVVIEGAECVAKSWPGFFEDLQSISSASNLVPKLK